jgi:TolB-like protein/tetratricopeptide (TPR) repeat protein
LKRLFEELRRRKVIRVAVAYLIVAWLLLQVADVTFEPMGLPAWTLKLVLVLLVLGFPLACVLAWVYDVTPRGVVATPPADEPTTPQSSGEAVRREPAAATPSRIPPPPTASAQSVAILPFVNMSPDPDQDYFCDGIAEEIINALCCVRGLRVASRTSSFRYKGGNEDVREIGRQLNVGSVLEGSVRKAGDRVRINAQLLNATEGYNLWSQSYDRTLEDVFAIQTDIAKQLVAALQVTLRPGEGELLGRGGTRNAQAYDYFLRGQQRLHAYGDGMEGAAMFRQALAFDPEFPQAHAGLASALALAEFAPDAADDLFEEAFAASRRALELEPWMPEAYLARAQIHSARGSREDAERDFGEAARLNPASYFTYYAWGRHCLASDQDERAVEMFRTAARLAPGEYTPLGMLSYALQKLGRREQSLEVKAEALRLIERHLQRFPEDDAAMSRGAIIAAWLGHRERALELIERTVRTRPDGHTGLYNAACASLVLGDRDRALDLLERAVRHGRGPLRWIETDDDLAGLRGDPRFEAIIERVRTASARTPT